MNEIEIMKYYRFFRSRDRRRSSRDRDRRRSTSRDRHRDRDRGKDKEKERERKRKGLPEIKKEHLSGMNQTFLPLPSSSSSVLQHKN